MNSSCDLTACMGVSLGVSVLVERSPFLAWVGWPWVDSTETGQYFEVLAYVSLGQEVKLSDLMTVGQVYFTGNTAAVWS